MACEIAKLHSADVTAVHVVEVPFSLPLETPLYHRTVAAESILKRAEAIGREFNVMAPSLKGFLKPQNAPFGSVVFQPNVS